MQDFPHIYKVISSGNVDGDLISGAENLPKIVVAPPKQFGGTGEQWSPEDLLMAAVANCLILSFKAIAKASKFEWEQIECEAEGILDKVERKLLFTHVVCRVKLVIPASQKKETAERLLLKAEETCLVSNSMSCESAIECEIVVQGE